MVALLFLALTFFSANGAQVQDKSLEYYKEIAKTIVHATAAGLGEIFKNAKSAKQKVTLIRAFIKPFRFYPNKSGCFHACDFQVVNVAHATQRDL